MKGRLLALWCFAAMGLVLLDGQTAQAGVREGLRLCAGAVVPALLPFFLLSNLLTRQLWGRSGRFLRFLGKVFRMPEGAECLLIPAFLGGYPAGAGAVGQAYAFGGLQKEQAQRLLGYCSNVGPAFLFGIVAGAFEDPLIGWQLWGSQILGALVTAWLLPGSPGVAAPKQGKTQGDMLTLAVLTMGKICVTVILFRVVLCYGAKYLPVEGTAGVLLGGLLELTNGCCRLGSVAPEWLRFLLCVGTVAFGGLCVVFQTASVTRGLGIGTYLRGKLLQTVLSAILACPAAALLYPGTVPAPILAGAAVLALILAGTAFFRQKRTGNFRPVPV